VRLRSAEGGALTGEFVHESPTAAQLPALDPGSTPLAASETSRPSGFAAAVVLAAGLASFALGLLSVLTAASASLSSALTVSDRVGDLSGVTTAVAVVFFAAGACSRSGGVTPTRRSSASRPCPPF
jgi:hypothetical protein